MSDLALVVSTLLGGAWDLFQTPVPGFTFTYADIVIGTMLASTALAILSAVIGRAGASSHGKTTQNPKTSKERMNDTK